MLYRHPLRQLKIYAHTSRNRPLEEFLNTSKAAAPERAPSAVDIFHTVEMFHA